MRDAGLWCRPFAVVAAVAVAALAAATPAFAQEQPPAATKPARAGAGPSDAGAANAPLPGHAAGESKSPPAAAARRPARPAARPARPATPATLEVTVLDPAGRPVAGAFVMALPATGAYVGAQLASEKVRSAITGQDGRARLERMPKGPWSVVVRARGLASGGELRVSASALTLKLEKGGAITGVVFDGATKTPIAGARVLVDEGLPLPGEWESRSSRAEAVADAKGVFRLEGIDRGGVSLFARAPGYGPARRDARVGAHVELFLSPGPTLFGTVRDEAGKPVAGAAVRLYAEGWSTPPPIDPTDAAGRFTAGGVEPGEYWVVARAGARAPGLTKVAVTERDDAAVELTLGDGGYATGRVVDEAGRAIADAVLRPETLDGRGLPQLAGEAMAAASAVDGTFALGPLPAGAVGLAVSRRGYATQRVTAAVASRQSVDLRDVVLEAGLAIRGRVRDREGLGLPGVLVRAEPRGGAAGPTADADTDAAGGFVVSGLSAGAYTLTAQADGLATARASATAGGEGVEIVMDAGGTITGRVVDAAGRPVDGATIFGEAAEPESPVDRSFVYGATGPDGDGRFTIRDAAPTTYVLRVRAAGIGEGSLAGVKVSAGRAIDVGSITLAGSGRVTGVAVDADGQAVPGATVRVRRDAQSAYSDDPNGQTDSAGAFDVRGVRPGRVDVVVSHPAYVGGRASGVEVDPEKEPPSVRIVLARGGRIEGRARHRDGRPFEDGRVTASPVAGNAGNAGFAGEPAPTLPDGSFAVEHVPAGRVAVSLMTRVASHPSISGSAGMTILAGVASREVEVRDGETTSTEIVTREVVVAGRVTRAGQGLAGVTVGVMTTDSGAVSAFMGMTPTAATPPPGPPPLSATTHEDGSYELLVFGPGRGYVQMRSPEPRQSYPGREVDIPDVERYELDLEVGDATVSGVVVDKDSGVPVAEAQVALREPGGDRKWKGGGASGPDGRFSIAAEPAEYVLEVSARGRKPSTVPVSVGSGGLSDVRVEMEAGLEIRGRVLDAAGRPAPDARVYAVDGDGRVTGRYGGAVPVLPDGTFRLTGLEAKPYTLVAGGAGGAGFAMRAGVTPDGDPVALALRPGGTVLARLVAPDGGPVKDAYPDVVSWDGVRFDSLPVGGTRAAEAPGVYEMSVPGGSLEITARWAGKTYGSATARVAPGETTTVDVVLRERPPR